MRMSKQSRETKETKIELELCLDGGENDISTGIGFFDHMLNSFAVHSGFSLKLTVKGDLNVDCHHTVEDTGIVLGNAFRAALGDKSDIKRYGNFYIPMDESLAFASVDISGRPFLVFDAEFADEKVGDFDTGMCEEFFRAFCFNAGITLHIKLLYGTNSHHKIEAIFKAAAHALKQAAGLRCGGILSTKGTLQ